MLFLLTTTFIFLNLDEVRQPLAVLKNCEKALGALQGYQYTTDEKGSDYEISFQGYLTENKLVGRIEEYDLYIYQEDSGLYVRNEEAKEWVEASSQGLTSIQCFLLGPADVLKQVLAKEHKHSMVFGEEGHLIQIPYQSDENALAHALFPGIASTSIQDFRVNVWVDAEDTLQKIEMTLHILTPDSSEEVISRSITLDYSAKPGFAYPDL
jgi:hypothetical protein